MKKVYFFLILFFAFVLTEGQSVFANGPLVVKGGMAITYGTRPLIYRFDKGPLGMFSNSEAIAIIEDLFMDWESISTSEFKFQRDNPGSLDFDVTASNYKSILEAQDLLGYTAVVFDTDGSVLELFLGMGSGNSVLGLSGPVTVNSRPLVNEIAESQAVFNGRFIDGIKTTGNPESTVDALMGTIIHEFGHGLGLDHSQINLEAIKPGASQDIKDKVPLMFPVAVNDLFLIRRDDASGISLLYPNQSKLGGFGKIEGKVFRQDGTTPVRGANVIATNVNDPTLEAISCVSDFLKDDTGSYTLFAVPPGNYKIEIEPIDLSFTGGSGVGPYTSSATDLSFQNPVPSGFYTGSGKPITSDPDQALVVNVSAGQNISNANIIAGSSILSSSSSTTSSSSTGGTGDINETEPNDSISTAQSVTPPVSISGMAAVGDDGKVELTSEDGSKLTISDLFRFDVPVDASLNALLVIEGDSSDNDLDIALFNGDGTQLIESSSQTGNADELISLNVTPGTYILGIGAFKGSASYKLTISLLLTGGAPSLSLSGPDTLVLIPGGMNRVFLNVNAINFTSRTTCTVFDNGESSVRIKPRSFKMGPREVKKTFKVKVPPQVASDFLQNNTDKVVTINVICKNGAGDQTDIHILPSVETVIENKSNWRITKTGE